MEPFMTLDKQFRHNPTIDPKTGHTVEKGSTAYNKLVKKYGKPYKKRSPKSTSPHKNITTINNNLTDNRDANTLILMELSGDDLLNLCAAFKGINKICYDQDFWNEKFHYDNLPGTPSLNNYVKINALTKQVDAILNSLILSEALFINMDAMVDIKPILSGYPVDISNVNNKKTSIQQLYIRKEQHGKYVVGVTYWAKDWKMLDYFQYETTKNHAISILMKIMYYLPNIDILDASDYSFIKNQLIEQINRDLLNGDMSKNSTGHKQLMKRLNKL